MDLSKDNLLNSDLILKFWDLLTQKSSDYYVINLFYIKKSSLKIIIIYNGK